MKQTSIYGGVMRTLLCALPLMWTSCSNLEVLDAGNNHEGGNADPLEIRMQTGMGAEKKSQSRGDGMIGANPSSLAVKLARANEKNASYTGWLENALEGTVATTTLTFGEKQYYSPSGLKTKFVGWYPASGTFTHSTPSVAFDKIDGSTDIMVSDLKEGSKLDPFGASKKLTFKHMLTQLSIKAWTTTQEAADIWGAVQSVTIKGMAQTCTVNLPAATAPDGSTATASFSGSDDLTLVAKDPSDNSALSDFTIGVSTANDSGQGGDGTDKTTVAKLWGYAMFAPVAQSTPLTLVLNYASGGTKEVTIPGQTSGLEAGKSYAVYLKFGLSTKDEITPEVEITDWQTGDDIDIEV